LARKPSIKNAAPRFGIGEWFGAPVANLSAEQRQAFGKHQHLSKKDRAGDIPPCPFLARRNNPACSKDGGVCSLKLYAFATHVADDGKERAKGLPVEGARGQLRATCPYRFHEDDEVFRWVGEVILDDANPKMLGEVGFLEAYATMDAEAGDDVGRIDMVLMKSNNPPGFPLEWCAVEIQAVYFSGSSMKSEFNTYADETLTWLAYPAGRRRPDYRSSGPKRLMPQLQIKVPTLRRWARKWLWSWIAPSSTLWAKWRRSMIYQMPISPGLSFASKNPTPVVQGLFVTRLSLRLWNDPSKV